MSKVASVFYTITRFAAIEIIQAISCLKTLVTYV